MEINCESSHNVVYQAIQHVMNHPEQASRNGKTKEALHVTIHQRYPTQRCLFLDERHDSIFHKIAETLWVLAGRNDVKFLSNYLPQASTWSDDGLTWRAGYGPRLRKWHNEVDQVANCVRNLLLDRDTRRAVMILFDPDEDNRDFKDIPCNNWIHWLIRDNKLEMSVSQRSSDVIWGLSGINLFEWTTLHQMMAYWVGADVGSLHYFISSLHIYERHYDMAQNIVAANLKDIAYPSTVGFRTPFYKMGQLLEDIFTLEMDWRNGNFKTDFTAYDDLLAYYAKMLKLYWMYKNKANLEDIWAQLQTLGNTDLAHAAKEYLVRQSYTQNFMVNYQFPG